DARRGARQRHAPRGRRVRAAEEEDVAAMPPTHFTVTQVRVAASCPRILYFDAEHTRRANLQAPSVTRIWKAGAADEGTACGTLFHGAVEKFNNRAAADPDVRDLLRTVRDPIELARKLVNHVYWNHVNQDALFQKTGEQQAAFLSALNVYVGEL